MTRPTAAKGTFPYRNHRTLEQIWGAVSIRQSRAFDMYNQISRERELTEQEIQAVIRLSRRLAA